MVFFALIYHHFPPQSAYARGELRCIGATTTREYKLYVEKDKALERRFQQVYVSQPTVKDTKMLRLVAGKMLSVPFTLTPTLILR